MSAEIQKHPGEFCEQALALIARGDIQSLTPQDQLLYYVKRCEAVGLDPATQPFEFMRLNGKLQLYAKKEAATQLTRMHKLSVTLVRDPEEQKRAGGLFAVAHARVKGPDGRESDDVGLVSLDNQRGESYANACMKAATKAKRRAVLGHCGLGMLDESELEGIRGRVDRVPVPYDDKPGTATVVSGGAHVGGPDPRRMQDAMRETGAQTVEDTGDYEDPDVMDAQWTEALS